MLLLAIDTATPQVAVARGDDGRVRGEIRLVGRRRHAEQLAPAIAYLCEQSRVRLEQLAAVAVGIGPGLFTGLRVGVTTATVMAQTLRIPVVAVPSPDLVAELAAGAEEVLLAGDGVEANRSHFAALERAEDAGAGFEAPSATALVELATGRIEREEFTSPWSVQPMYLRASDAELAWSGRR